MIRFILLIVVAAGIAGCRSTEKTKVMETPKKEEAGTREVHDTTPKVTGIGGIFFMSDDPQKTRDWYAKNLGMEINDWGSAGFESRDLDEPKRIHSLQWNPFKKGNDYFAPSEKEFMINYRVQNIEGLIEKLKQNGVTILDSLETYDYGKFIHILDSEGNKIELWEPAGEDERPL